MRNTQQATALKGSSHDSDDDFLFCAFSFVFFRKLVLRSAGWALPGWEEGTPSWEFAKSNPKCHTRRGQGAGGSSSGSVSGSLVKVQTSTGRVQGTG